MLGGVSSAQAARGRSKAKRIRQDLFIGRRKNNHLLNFSPEIH
jgi:hypothetical protein